MASHDAPILVVDDDPTSRRRSAACRPGKVMLAVAALVLGIGSCQLPQPRPPKLPLGMVAGASALVPARASTHTPGDQT